ncbi:MAG: general secretion pathway protein D [Planctomycetota bacterium]|jgi:general secretion pathway protein D
MSILATVLALFVLQPLALPQATEQVPPIQEVGGAYVLNFADDSENSMALETFVLACEEVTSINFTYSDETATLLKTTKVRLLGTKRVPKTEFYSFFQIIMIINDFVCSEIGADPLAVVVIESLKTQARNTIRADAIYVEPDRLHEYANQPATLITTVITLPNTDVRQLSNAMRTMITDANTQQMLPAGNTDSMVLVGFGSNVAATARMLRIVDQASKVDPVLPEFEVIPLEYASADEIASTIEELLEASRRAVQGGRTAQPQQGATGQLQPGQTEAKIMVDPRTNSLLVMAMPLDMPGIKELIARLDVNVVERERSYHIYKLDNVNAEQLSETLNDFLQDASRLEQNRQSNAQGGQRAAGASSRTQEFVVVPDNETNSLLIAASRTRYEELLALIKRLDQRQDQVLIETALVELSARDFYDVGVELGFADLPIADERGGFGVTGFGLSSITDGDGDGILDTRVPNVPSGGISAGILDGDMFSLPMMIQLLQEKRNSNVLNVPSVLVNNNGTAIVVSKEEQPTTQISQTQFGQQESPGDYVEAGVTMQISPSISASNYLRLNIFLEVSNFIGSPQGNIPPPITTRTIDTSVNVPDGDTMVIGGIIIDNTQTTTNQVPILGDIPILGQLFRRDSETQDHTALYFFVTPHILRDEHFADLAEISYRKKLEAADTIGAKRIRLIDPAFGESQQGIDLSGFDLPLYTSPQAGEVDEETIGLDKVEINNLLRDARRPVMPQGSNSTQTKTIEESARSDR